MRAVSYDLESYPNFFSCAACTFGNPNDVTAWEISDRRNDVVGLLEWLNFIADDRVPMIGFNNIGYDYHLLHALLSLEAITAYDLYQVTCDIIGGQGREIIWPNDRYVPQIDLYKIHHFDNKAKRTSLKSLQFNMRSESIEDLPYPPGTYLTSEQMDVTLSYNKHDVAETDKFAQITMPNIVLRQQMLDSGMLKGDVLNFNDTKLGKELLIQRLGEGLCYNRSTGRREPRQTIRARIPLRDVVFPYIQFQHPEFKRVHEWLLNQTLEPEDFDGVERASTKGVFKDLKATIDGFDFNFGTGGIHGSLERSAVFSDDEQIIMDSDVASLYPSIAIVNQLAPEHLGHAFVDEYTKLREERFKHAKGTPENAALKLALNGTYGDSNNIFSPLYDPLFTMRITINGQLMLCMLAEWLMNNIEELYIIQINTDGLSARIPRDQEATYRSICAQWEQYTCLELEHNHYQSLYMRDVNNYVAIDAKGKVKAKGAFWHPNITGTTDDYNSSISNAGPSKWHADLSAPIIPYAAVRLLSHSEPIETTIYSSIDPYAFCLRAKATGKDKLFIDDTPQQRVTRYYVALRGGSMVKVSPPVIGKKMGAFKKAGGVSDYEYDRHDPFTWNEAVHTKNRSTYEERRTSIINGRYVTECNQINRFDWLNLDYEWYVSEANKLVDNLSG